MIFAWLHPSSAAYALEMTLGKRIKLARERLKPKPTQADVGAMFGGSARCPDESVMKPFPELYKIAKLAKQPKGIWLIDGGSPPLEPDSIEAKLHQFGPRERTVLAP